MLEVLSNLVSLIQNNTTITVVVVTIVLLAAFVQYRWQERNERRARDNFSIERRRLTEVNVKVDYDLELSSLQPSSEPDKKTAFLSLRLPIQNIGDGPIDILAVLIAGRLLSAEYKAGIAKRSRDVEWSDFQPLYWNSPDDHAVFLGLSTTKNAISRAKDFVRLSARESGVLRRIDAVNNIDKALSLEDLLVRHRLFVVARGYPLGEILRQLGGGPPDPSVNVIQGNLQFQALATPAFHRWETVQEAIFNLNRFVFRIAIFDPRKPEESGDPLGLLTDPDAWRIFLLYHWEFVDEASAAPDFFRDRDGFKKRLKHGKMLPNFSDIITSLTDEVKELYPDLVLPSGWQQDTERWQKAQQLCRARLGSFIERWIHMRTAIELCQAYRSNVDPYSGHARGHYVDEGYPALIFHSPYYDDKLKENYKNALAKDYREAKGKPFVEPELDFRERWFALMLEGYLISKPFPRRFRRGYNINRDIPSDPRNLEPFVMRTHSLMTSVPIPHPQDTSKRRSAPL